MIWLIGCKGMLGTEIARQLKENNMDYVGTDIDVDITSYEALKSFAVGKDISYIINCSAYTAVDKAESDRELTSKLNEEGPRNIARVAKSIGAKMIHISTDYVFDGTGNTPRTEDMTIAPIGVYGVTKAAGEQAVRTELSEHYIVRTAWLYGWAGKNFVYTMIRAMNANGAVKVVADQKGTPTFAGDLAKIILRIISNGDVPYGTYHCTNMGEITWYDFAISIRDEAKKAGWLTRDDVTVFPCTTEEYPTPAKRPAYSVLSKEKIQKALNMKLPEWQESLRYFLTNPLFDKERIK